MDMHEAYLNVTNSFICGFSTQCTYYTALLYIYKINKIDKLAFMF